jgi:EmrB/QacA subfamily drug resistance transporter
MSEIINNEPQKGALGSLYYVLLVLALGVFMTALDSIIFSPALPTIVGDLHTSFDWVAWTMTIYMLFFAAIMPLGGKLSDVFGRKRVYIAGIALFTLGSFLSSLSWDIYSLIAFRGIQAIGGGLVLPAALAAMSSAAPKEQQGKTMGALMAMSAVAMVIGPSVGGYFISHFGWRSVFYINIPIGIIAIILALRFKESYGEKGHHIDLVGSGLLTSGLAAILLGMVRLESLPLTDLTVFPFFLAAILLGVILVVYEKRVPEPILDMATIARGNVLSLNVAALLTSVSLGCAMMYVPSFAQLVLHMNVEDSSNILTPLSVSLLIAAIVGGILIDKFGSKPILLIGTMISVVGVFGMAQYVNDSLSLAIVLAIIGLGMGIGMGAFQIIMISFMPKSEVGTGTGILNTFRNSGMTVGSVIGGFFLADATSKVVTYAQAFSNIFWFGTVISILAVIMIAYLIVIDRKRIDIPVSVPAQQ